MNSAQEQTSTPSEAECIKLLKGVRDFGGNRTAKNDLKTRLSLGGIGLAARMIVDFTLATGGCRVDDPYNTMDEVLDKGFVGSCWQNNMLVTNYVFRHLFARGMCRHRIMAMVSESKDGDIIARVCRDLGGNCVRGSTSRRATHALRSAVRELERGGVVVITPDGPRGPRHKLQDGIFHVARMSSKPIVPMSGSFGRALRMERSWDRFEIPIPFGKVTLHCGKPLYVPRDITDGNLQKIKDELALRMRRVTRRANAKQQKFYSLGKPREK